MGAYIHPKTETSEQWLNVHGEPFDAYGTLWEELPVGDLAVCLAWGGQFYAAGIAYSEAEYLEFLRPDGRVKQWYLVAEDGLRQVSPELKGYLKQSRAVTKRG